jgi:hypothetical protein
MVITQITGGLGNQLFQYAMARRLAIRHNTDVLLDTSSYGPNGEERPVELAAFNRALGLCNFRIKARVAAPAEILQLRDNFYRATTRDRLVRQLRRAWPRFLWNTSHVIERQYRFQPEALNWPDNVYLQGFWQSPLYFQDIAALIREEFKVIDDSLSSSAKAAVERLKAQHGEVVSLHVRRGDLAHAHENLGRNNITHGAPVTTEYITHAMARFEPDTCFFVFSDSPKDIEWCRQNVRAKNLEFSSAESDLWDLTAMTYCDHHIIANSTFSWWAAWLNPKSNKRVVAPGVWSSPFSGSKMLPDDLVPSDWIQI